MKRKVFGAALLAITNLGHTALRATDAVDLPALKARKTELETEILQLRGKDLDDAANAEALQEADEELRIVTSQIETKELRARNATLEASITAQRTSEADTAIKAAVKRGAIKPSDLALQAKWKERCIEDPDNISLLAAMPGSPALEHRRIIMPRSTITREDSGTVLKAFNAEKDSRKKGEIYANELSKRIADGEELPIRANNTLGTLSGEIVAQRTLELLAVEVPMLGRMATDFSDEAAKLNQQVTSRIVGIPTSSDYDTTNGYDDEDSIMIDVPVTITEHKSVQVMFTANDLAGTSRRLFDEMAPAMAQRVALDFTDKGMSVITAANFPSAPVVAADVNMSLKTVTKMSGALSDRGVPRGSSNRTLLLNGLYYDALFSDEILALLAANQREDLITGDELINLRGFATNRASTLPAAENLKGFGFSKSAIVISGRVPNDYTSALPTAASNGIVQVITNVKTGLSVMLVQFVNHKLGRAYARMAYMYGAGKGQPDAGQRLTS